MSRSVVAIPRERFEQLVADALDQIPEPLARLMDNVAVFVEDGASAGTLLGRYEGVPLTDRDAGYSGMVMPDRITVYRRAICGLCRDEDEVVHQVLVTVVHEVAHHFGIGDERLHELGWG